MANEVRIALRTTQEFKDAVKALLSVRLIDNGRVKPEHPMYFVSTNDVQNQLAVAGMEAVECKLDEAIAEVTSAIAMADDILRFLLANPTAQKASARDFSPDSAEYCFLSKISQDEDGSRNYRQPESLLFDKMCALPGNFISEPTRSSITATLASLQDHRSRYLEAKSALQRAMKVDCAVVQVASEKVKLRLVAG